MFTYANISRTFLVALSLLIWCARDVAAQDSGSHTVNIGISPITVMSISGDPLPFILDVGENAERVIAKDASTFYNLTTNIENVYIQAELDLPMPEGSELWISGLSHLGNSHGRVQLSEGRPLPLISGISRGLENGQPILYEFVVTSGAEDIPFQSRSITLTIVDRMNERQEQHIQTVYFSSLSSSEAERE